MGDLKHAPTGRATWFLRKAAASFLEYRLVCRIRSLRCRVLVCDAADTASLATGFLFGKLFCVAITFGFGKKRCRKNLPLCDLAFIRMEPDSCPRADSSYGFSW